eukprot:TRINITY_DN17518_c0_g1_i1.p1 TRINITY_DN17518_c0_g1~~TRINITY_DN17518_c0_g1_i1.p1  ORF type:complete len:419 (-),score=49.81 TRINITY_DN17518_c0_g1_i1:23-1279(-)
MTDLNNRHLREIYYKRLFPSDLIYDWLSFGQSHALEDVANQPSLKDIFLKREFALTLDNGLFTRYNCYSNLQEFREGILKNVPIKIDIGAIYSFPPRDKNSYQVQFKPEQKELVFDIDIDAYDFRSCCTGAGLCQFCWKLLVVAIRVLDKRLSEDFGFLNRLWVFSGRRGIHCWISDTSARSLSDEGRSAIVSYLSLLTGGDNQVKKVNFSFQKSLHPMIQETYESILLPAFEKDILIDQGLLDTPERWSKVLALHPSPVFDKLNKEWLEEYESGCQELNASVTRWQKIKDLSKGMKTGENMILEVVVTYTWPRLDQQVSRSTHHLLKAPFVLHPSTGKVCVPVDAAKCDEFDPNTVPTLENLIKELDDYMEDSGTQRKLRDYKKTSLRESVVFFKKYLKPLIRSMQGERVPQDPSKW